MAGFNFEHSTECTLDLAHEEVIFRISFMLHSLEKLDKKNWHHKTTYLVLQVDFRDLGFWVTF
jgi:hypothetical protein